MNFAWSNGNILWSFIEKSFIVSIILIFFNLALASVLTEFSNKDDENYYFYLIIYNNLTLLYFYSGFNFFFYIFSPSNYHLGRIIMKNKSSQIIESTCKSRKKKGKREKARKYDENSNERKEQTGQSSTVVIEENYRIQKPEKRRLSLKSIVYKNGYHISEGQQKSIQKKKFFKDKYPFNLPSPVTYINDQEFPSEPEISTNLPVRQYKLDNLNINSGILTPYQSIKIKLKNKTETSETNPLALQMRNDLKINSDKDSLLPILPKSYKIAKKEMSKTSVASTGSDYYAEIFKDGKIPKVGSISQYGSL